MITRHTRRKAADPRPSMSRQLLRLTVMMLAMSMPVNGMEKDTKKETIETRFSRLSATPDPEETAQEQATRLPVPQNVVYKHIDLMNTAKEDRPDYLAHQTNTQSLIPPVTGGFAGGLYAEFRGSPWETPELLKDYKEAMLKDAENNGEGRIREGKEKENDKKWDKILSFNGKGVSSTWFEGLSDEQRKTLTTEGQNYDPAPREQEAGTAHIMSLGNTQKFLVNLYGQLTWAIIDGQPEEVRYQQLNVVTRCGEDTYPMTPDALRKRRVEYMRMALADFKRQMPHDEKKTIMFVFEIGCGLAGGQWDVYRDMIYEFAREMQQHEIWIGANLDVLKFKHESLITFQAEAEEAKAVRAAEVNQEPGHYE